MKYCDAVYKTKRRITRQVLVGNIGVGGNNPVRIQSMTTSSTRDAEATIDQIMKLADYGCEIARVTVQGMKEADTCELIKDGLIKRGYTIPVVADIHFFPPAAMRVVDFVDKVRINPGNYVDKRASFKVIEYDDASYQEELDRIEEKFTPLIDKCKKLKRSMRIGTNHGSLSDRIMNRYGDTPAGMVESALEFARVCRKNDYHDFMFSMKSSNPQVMIQAYRLLVAEMDAIGWDYPLHLGVTEAGDGEDGRIKSAMGIGALLLDGIGDTIRVSLTEDPWFEIDPCKRLVLLGESYLGRGVAPFEESYRHIEAIQRRKVDLPKHVSMHRDGTVVLKVSPQEIAEERFYHHIGCGDKTAKPKIQVSSADNLYVDALPKAGDSLSKLITLKEIGLGLLTSEAGEIGQQVVSLRNAIQQKNDQQTSARFQIGVFPSSHKFELIEVREETAEEWESIKELKPSLLFLNPKASRLHYARQFFQWLQQNSLSIPVILHFKYDCSKEDLPIHAGAECGALLTDGLGEGVWIEGPYELDYIRNLSFSILQAARMRSSKTDFISCPSCGRTLFDLQDVTKRIQSRTAHLPGVKIAIMGCIVNGPGEMADAHFGYVGSKPGKIDLYVGKSKVESDIDFAEADERLVKLIKDHGMWKDKED